MVIIDVLYLGTIFEFLRVKIAHHFPCAAPLGHLLPGTFGIFSLMMTDVEVLHIISIL